MPWRQMAGMRDLVVHAYRNINPDEVWKAVSISVPALIQAAERLVPEDPESETQANSDDA
ncbi:MAG TPA: HepT-like ribonuclease domain-containing protein [Longimicrobium sp.]|nr:HepT-like ribonuclease domain-containing protein [Longimicrobium sp.]